MILSIPKITIYLKKLNDCGYEMKIMNFNSYLQLIKDNKFELFKNLIFNTKNFDINMKSENNGNTLLHETVNDGCIYVKFIELLLDCGADKNLKNNDGKSAYELSLRLNRQTFFDY